jgi:hypothetical protein
LQGVDEFSPQREDLVGVAKDQSTHLGEDQVTAHAGEQLFTEGGFESVDLSADRRLRQVQLCTGTRNTPLTRYNPKIVQMVIVEPFHTSVTILRLFLWINQEISHLLNSLAGRIFLAVHC